MEREMEIIRKIAEVGFALTDEGIETDNNNLVETGQLMLFLSSIVDDPETLDKFKMLAGMLSSSVIIRDILPDDDLDLIAKDEDELNEISKQIAKGMRDTYLGDDEEDKDEDEDI